MNALLNPTQVEVVNSVTELCDSCGAAAKLGVRLSGGGELSFCGHHANRHAGEIAKTANSVLVEAGFAWTGSSRTA
ncbi:DUF7455 domain-containing protein [Catenuloplanes japonicus]|uniref:DUF7455 domain-containing protein n=1 Tax=Catenuloplanes japonicus TaxID=33876 RepID=UPI00052539CB|nr:hypothetical protein [Catenuloplanes japonicus]